MVEHRKLFNFNYAIIILIVVILLLYTTLNIILLQENYSRTACFDGAYGIWFAFMKICMIFFEIICYCVP